MTFVVPFDDSELSRAALVRAGEYGDALDEDVVAVAAIPGSTSYALEKGWIDARGEFDVGSVADRLRAAAQSLVADVGFSFRTLRSRPPEGAIAKAIVQLAREADATVVFIGSENAGRIVQPVTSVGGAVAAEHPYEVHIVRTTDTVTIESLEAAAEADVD